MNCEKYKPTYILIALNVAIYIYGAIVGGNALDTPDDVAVVLWGQVNYFVSTTAHTINYSRQCLFTPQYSI